MSDTQTPMQFRDLRPGDELVLRGDEIDASAIILKVHPFELITHWIDVDSKTAQQVAMLGSHANFDDEKPFGARFMPSELQVHTFILIVPNLADTPELEELRYLKVTREGKVIYEAGEYDPPGYAPTTI